MWQFNFFFQMVDGVAVVFFSSKVKSFIFRWWLVWQFYYYFFTKLRPTLALYADSSRLAQNARGEVLILLFCVGPCGSYKIEKSGWIPGLGFQDSLCIG